MLKSGIWKEVPDTIPGRTGDVAAKLGSAGTGSIGIIGGLGTNMSRKSMSSVRELVLAAGSACLSRGIDLGSICVEGNALVGDWIGDEKGASAADFVVLDTSSSMRSDFSLLAGCCCPRGIGFSAGRSSFGEAAGSFVEPKKSKDSPGFCDVSCLSEPTSALILSNRDLVSSFFCLMASSFDVSCGLLGESAS